APDQQRNTSLRYVLRRIRGTRLILQRHAEAAGEILDELPGDAAGARAARRRPFQRVAMQIVGLGLDAVMADVAVDHRQIFVLAAAVEAEPEAEAVRQRHL